MFAKMFKHFFNLLIIFSSLAYSKKCGISYKRPLVNFSPKIINGVKAVPHSWPWIVSLRKGTISNSTHFCGGSLIDSKTVVTAAHCFASADFSVSQSELVVTVGINSLNEKLVEGINAFKVERIRISSNWNQTDFQNDIAIIKLKKSVTFSRKIQPICLPRSSKKNVVYNKDLMVAGWGLITSASMDPVKTNILRQTRLRVINNSTICEGYENQKYCAIDISEKESNTCQGDSGGPLMYLIRGRWYLYGLVSFGFGDFIDICINTKPSFHTIVPNYLTWISKNRI